MSTSTDTFHIVLQRGTFLLLFLTLVILTRYLGIEGGFAPPIPHALYTIARSSDSDVIKITTQTRPHGTPSLLPPDTKELKVADHTDTIAKLQLLLRELPPQFPGARDLYGRNTSIVQRANPGDFLPSGSIAGSGIQEPTEEQRVQFDEAVAIIEKWVAA